MIESPKKRFLQTQHAKRLFEMVVDPAVIAGLDASMLQMQWEVGAAKTPEIAAALHWQMTGAAKFREVFLTVSVMDKPQPSMRGDNLPHET
jgi:hypothetical protein